MLPHIAFMICFLGTFFLAMGAVWKWTDEDTQGCLTLAYLAASTGMIAAYILIAY